MQKILLTLIIACTFINVTIAQTTRSTTQATSQPTTSPSSQPTKMMDKMNVPYQSIGEFPEAFTPAAVMQRAIDGLGYRYHWASEGLTEKDLAYDPGNAGKTAAQVLEHIHGLSLTILKTVLGETNVRPAPKTDMDFETLRHSTLSNLKQASDYLNANPNLDFNERNVIFSRGETASSHSFWRLINGPLLDAVYHTGQIVSYRRSTGNPSNPKVNVFRGTDPNSN